MYKVFVKRLLDIILSSLMIVICLPLMIIIALIIKKDGGSAIFIQKRSGKDNDPFMIYKFRTMHIENDVHDFKCEDRITKFGKFLKRTSLDELPQLFNILKGDMSFIGPRPWITDYSKYYTLNQMKRLSVKPGLTGLAQCCGRNSLSIIEKINYDLEYVEDVSFINDIKIVFLTIKSLLDKDSASTTKFTIKSELDELKKQTRYQNIIFNSKYENATPLLSRNIYK